jgi:hypothetical protein
MNSLNGLPVNARLVQMSVAAQLIVIEMRTRIPARIPMVDASRRLRGRGQ